MAKLKQLVLIPTDKTKTCCCCRAQHGLISITAIARPMNGHRDTKAVNSGSLHVCHKCLLKRRHPKMLPGVWGRAHRALVIALKPIAGQS